MEKNEGLHSRLWDYSIDYLEFFKDLGPTVTFKKGDIIGHAGDITKYCYYITEGRVVGCESSVSNDHYYNFSETGCLAMESFLILQNPLPVNFIALTQVTAVRIDYDTLSHHIMTDPKFAMELVTSVCWKFEAAMDEVREAVGCNVAWKVCNLLMDFADHYGVPYDGKILIKEKISQQVMANLLSINRITMVRTIKDLRELNLIEQVNGYYCIRDIAKLQNYMDEIFQDIT